MFRSFLLFVAIGSLPCHAVGGVTSFTPETHAINGAPGYNTFNFKIDFTGILREQQLSLQLTQGWIKFSPRDDIDPPAEFLAIQNPIVEFDTIVTFGAYTAESSEAGVLVIGGAVDLGRPPELIQAIDDFSVAWRPSPGVDIHSRTDYPVARVSVTSDARGRLDYLGTTDNGDVFQTTWLFRNGSLHPADPLSGDFNFDDRVDNADLSLLLGAWGDEDVPEEWIHNFVGPSVDNGELTSLLATWGSVEPQPCAAPEPSAALLLLWGTIAARYCGRLNARSST